MSAEDPDDGGLADSPFEKTDADPAAGGEQLDGQPSGGVLGRLKNTEPNRPLEEVGNLTDIRERWTSYGLRGLEKFAGADDAWAGVDLLKFALGATLEVATGGGEQDTDDDGGEFEDIDVSGEMG